MVIRSMMHAGVSVRRAVYKERISMIENDNDDVMAAWTAEWVVTAV